MPREEELESLARVPEYAAFSPYDESDEQLAAAQRVGALTTKANERKLAAIKLQAARRGQLARRMVRARSQHHGMGLNANKSNAFNPFAGPKQARNYPAQLGCSNPFKPSAAAGPFGQRSKCTGTGGSMGTSISQHGSIAAGLGPSLGATKPNFGKANSRPVRPTRTKP